MRVEIVGAMGTRAGRPFFVAIADGVEGVIELDNSAVAKLAGNAIGERMLAAIDNARAAIMAAATRLHPAGVSAPGDDGRWHLLLSGLDLD